jgi:hypothetical protein
MDKQNWKRWPFTSKGIVFVIFSIFCENHFSLLLMVKMPSLEKFASELSSIIPAANAGAQPLLSAFAPESTIFDCPASEGGRFSDQAQHEIYEKQRQHRG